MCKRFIQLVRPAESGSGRSLYFFGSSHYNTNLILSSAFSTVYVTKQSALWMLFHITFGYNQIMLKIIRSKAFFVLEIILLALFALLWVVSTLPGFYDKLAAIGYAYCHQIPSRSFLFGSHQFAFCHRCSGLFLGIAWAFIWQLPAGKAGKVFTPGKVIFCILSLFFYVADSLNNTSLTVFGSGHSLYPPSAILRTLSGFLMGTAITILIYPIFNNVFWIACDPDRGTLPSYKAKVGLFGTDLLTMVLLFSGNTFILTIFDVFSALAAILLTAGLYIMLILLFFRLEIRFDRFLEGKNFLLLGLLFAVVQITLIAFLRFRLTGVWYWPF